MDPLGLARLTMVPSSTTAPAVDIDALRVTYVNGDTTVLAVDIFSLAVAAGEVVAILGPSGCGKSSVLNAVAGFVEPSAGEVRFKSTGPDIRSGEIAMAFQDVGLFPWLSALDNAALRLRYAGLSRRDRHRLARDMLERVGLDDDVGKFPHQLSGGMRQRVGLARAMLGGPSILLLDEPFGSLDSLTRIHMQELLLSLLQSSGAPTVLLVTHDVSEALFLADRVVVMGNAPGHIRKILDMDSPRPRDRGFLLSPAFDRMRSELLTLIL